MGASTAFVRRGVDEIDRGRRVCPAADRGHGGSAAWMNRASRVSPNGSAGQHSFERVVEWLISESMLNDANELARLVEQVVGSDQLARLEGALARHRGQLGPE